MRPQKTWMAHRFVASGAVAAAVLLGPCLGHADTESCISLHASGQREANSGHLHRAVELFISCGSSDQSCPVVLKKECLELLERTRIAIPTVILSVLDGNGRDVSAVKVYSSDALVADGLGGRAIALDPGKHRLRFVLPQGEELTRDVVIREGEKNRIIEVQSEKREAESKPAIPPSIEPVKTSASPGPRVVGPRVAGPRVAGPQPRSTLPISAWVLSGVAVAGAGVFGTFALVGNGSRRELDECSPACDPSTRGTFDRLKTWYLAADIGLGVAAVSAIAAAYVFISHGKREQSVAHHQAARFRITPTGSPNGGGIVVSRSFF